MEEIIKCKRDFHLLIGKSLSSFGTGVNEAVSNNSDVFDPTKIPQVPLTHSEMLTYLNSLDATYDAYDKGGSAQKPDYETAMGIVMSCVNKFADYVDIVSKGDPKIIIKGGFKPTHALPDAIGVIPGQAKQVMVFNNLVSGVIDTECETFGPYSHYVCFAVEGLPFPANMQTDAAGMFIIPATFINKVIVNLTKGRKKAFSGLTKGIEYYFYYVVINATGVGPISVAVNKMCA